MKQYPTAEEFNSLSDAALARYFRWYAERRPLMEDDPFKQALQPHIGEMIEFLKDYDPDWASVFSAIVAAKDVPSAEKVCNVIWARMKELLEQECH